MTIKFSPEIVQFLPQYLGLSVQRFIKVTGFKYTKGYLYNVISSHAVLNAQLDSELNKVWNELGLDFTDLENIYQISKLVKEGSDKLQQFEGGK